MNAITDLANNALCAVASVQAFCFEADLNMACYALNSAQNDIDTIKQMVERNEIIEMSKLTEFVAQFEKYGEFEAAVFLKEFAEFEGGENGE
jgi:hypothetical protein